jgi:hypothetical protein
MSDVDKVRLPVNMGANNLSSDIVKLLKSQANESDDCRLRDCTKLNFLTLAIAPELSFVTYTFHYGDGTEIKDIAIPLASPLMLNLFTTKYVNCSSMTADVIDYLVNDRHTEQYHLIIDDTLIMKMDSDNDFVSSLIPGLLLNLFLWINDYEVGKDALFSIKPKEDVAPFETTLTYLPFISKEQYGDGSVHYLDRRYGYLTLNGISRDLIHYRVNWNGERLSFKRVISPNVKKVDISAKLNNGTLSDTINYLTFRSRSSDLSEER